MTDQEGAVTWLERNYDKTMQADHWCEYYDSEGLVFVVAAGARGTRYLPMLEIKTDCGFWCEPMRWKPISPEGMAL